jgi:hypothetical protein
MKGFRILIHGSGVKKLIANEEKLLAFYVVIFANGKEQKDAEAHAIEMAVAALQKKDGVIPDEFTACSISEIYEFKYGYYVEEEVLGFVFFDDQEDAPTSWRGRVWNGIDRWITRMKFRKLGFIQLHKETLEPRLVWLSRGQKGAKPKGSGNMSSRVEIRG